MSHSMLLNQADIPPATGDIHNQQFGLDLACACHLEFFGVSLNSPGIRTRLDLKGRHRFSGVASPRREFPLDRIAAIKA